MLGRSAKDLNTRMRELNDKGTLPRECGKLCRMVGHLGDELSTLSPEVADDDSVSTERGSNPRTSGLLPALLSALR